MAILRFVGWDVPAPRVSLRPSDVRRGLAKTYARKRKALEGGHSSRTRPRLLAPDTDLMDHEQPKSLQLAPQNYTPAAPGEVQMEIILGLQDRLPTVDAFFGDPSIQITTELTVVPNASKIAQSRMDQSPRADDGTVIEKAAPALEPTELSDSLFDLNLPPFDAEKTKNVNTATANENRVGEFEEFLFHNYRVEDGGDLEEKPILPTNIQTVLVRRKKEGAEEDLNLVSETPGYQINCSTKTTDKMEIVDTVMIPSQADTRTYYSHNAGYHENAPTLSQEKNPLGASACANIHKNKARQIMPQPPTSTDTKVESVPPEMKRNVEPAALNSIENSESVNLHHKEKTGNVMAVDVAKNGQDKKIVKQREKCKKNDGLPKDVKDHHAAKAQKDHVAQKPLPSFEGFFN